MPVRITNFSRNTISSQLKAISKTELQLKRLNACPDERKFRSDFMPGKNMMKSSHMLPLKERLSMYKLGSPAGDFSPRKPKKKKMTKPKKAPRRFNLKLIPSVTLQLPAKYCLSSDRRDTKRRSISGASVSVVTFEENSILEVFEDDIETLVQKYLSPHQT